MKNTTLFFCTNDETADLLGMSPNGLSEARARGELRGLWQQVGRRVLWSRPAIMLLAMGITSPADLGAFVRAAGIGSLAELAAFLDDEATP